MWEAKGSRGASRESHGAIGLLLWVHSWFMRHMCLYISAQNFSCTWADGRTGPPEVVQEVLADVKQIIIRISRSSFFDMLWKVASDNPGYRHLLSINKKLCYTLLTSYPLDQTGLDGFPRKISPHYLFMTSPWNHTEDEVSKFATYFVCARKLFWIHHPLHYQNFIMSGITKNWLFILLLQCGWVWMVGGWLDHTFFWFCMIDDCLISFL